MGLQQRSSDGTPGCRVCGSFHVERWGAKRGRQFVDREFTFWRCRDCDVRFVEPVTGPEIYDEAYYQGRGVDPLVDYVAEYADYRRTPRLDEFEGLANLAERHFSSRADAGTPGPLRWLDYGCGAGGLLKYLRDRGSLGAANRERRIEVSGFDVGEYAERLRADGLPVHTLETLRRIPDSSLDVISLVEVIEHLDYPMDILADAARWLRPEGLLILTTGNLASPLARWQGIQFGYCIPEIHVTLWTPRALETAYARVGLVPFRARVSGSLRFKIRKNLGRFPSLKAITSVWLSPPVLRGLDRLFGASAMPMAIKPRLVSRSGQT
jgi:SAM-dependent methyltransferase